jgi:hypothetical protein
MDPQLKKQHLSIVLLGDFYPVLFHPSWFAHRGLMKQEEVDAAEVKLIHPDAAMCDIEWLQLRVDRGRFQVLTTQEAYFEPLRDLAISIFDIQYETPVRVMGINRVVHYQLDSEDALHRIGHRLAPKENWDDILENPGMLSLTMQATRPEKFKGYIRVRVGPSGQVKSGVFVEVNDHYHLCREPDSPEDSIPACESEMKSILANHWADSLDRGLRIALRVARLGVDE